MNTKQRVDNICEKMKELKQELDVIAEEYVGLIAIPEDTIWLHKRLGSLYSSRMEITSAGFEFDEDGNPMLWFGFYEDGLGVWESASFFVVEEK